MSSEFEVIEKRIQNLEALAFGQEANGKDGEELLDTLLAISRKLGNITTKNEKVSAVLRRVEEVEKYSDPLYAEADSFVPDAVKYQLIVSQEQKLQETLDQSEKLNGLKHVLESQAISAVPHLESRLSKITSVQASQELQVSKLSNDTCKLVQMYSDLVNSISQSLAEMEPKV